MNMRLDESFFGDLERWNQAVCEAMARRDLSALGWLCPEDLWPSMRLSSDDPMSLCEALEAWGLSCWRVGGEVVVRVPPDEVLLHTILGRMKVGAEIRSRESGGFVGEPAAEQCLPLRLQPHEVSGRSPELRWLSVRVFGAVCERGRLVPRARRCLILWNTPWGIWVASDVLKPSLQRLAGGRRLPMWTPGPWRRWRGVALEALPESASPQSGVWPPIERRLARRPALLSHQATLAVPVYLLGDRTLLFAAGTGRQLHRLGAP